MARFDTSKQRRFARAKEALPIQLKFSDGKREFSATVHSHDISVSGIFLATTFYLKPGLEMDLEFQMPNDERTVRCRGVIVREVHIDEGAPGHTVSGFAMRFVDYYDDAKTVLASSFLIVELDDFINDYLRRRTRKPRDERELLKDVLVAWEVGKMDLSEGEEELLHGRLKVDEDGKIIRREAIPGASRSARPAATRRTAPPSRPAAATRSASKPASASRAKSKPKPTSKAKPTPKRAAARSTTKARARKKGRRK